MDAQRVFEFCRRLLHDQEFQERVLSPATADHLAELGLDPDDQAIAGAFHAQRDNAYWAFEGFRYRATTVATDSLVDYAPLTARLLAAHALAPRTVARDFVEFAGYPDYGLNYCRTALELLAYLEAEFLPESAIPYLADTIALDRAMTGLLHRVAGLPDGSWPARSEPLARRANQLYVRSPLCDAVACAHDITPWLEDPERVDNRPLATGPVHMLVQFLPDEVALDFLIIGAGGYRLYQALERASTAADIVASLDDRELANSLIDDFLDLDVIRPLLVSTTE